VATCLSCSHSLPFSGLSACLQTYSANATALPSPIYFLLYTYLPWEGGRRYDQSCFQPGKEGGTLWSLLSSQHGHLILLL